MAVNFIKNTKETIDATPIVDGQVLWTTDQPQNKIYSDNGTKRVQIGGTIEVDNELSTTSTNAVANNVVTNSIDKLNSNLTPTFKHYITSKFNVGANASSRATLNVALEGYTPVAFKSIQHSKFTQLATSQFFFSGSNAHVDMINVSSSQATENFTEIVIEYVKNTNTLG